MAFAMEVSHWVKLVSQLASGCVGPIECWLLVVGWVEVQSKSGTYGLCLCFKLLSTALKMCKYLSVYTQVR